MGGGCWVAWWWVGDVLVGVGWHGGEVAWWWVVDDGGW